MAKNNKFISFQVPRNEVEKTLKILDQTGKTDITKDKGRTAKLPGKRISKTGKVYWETRKNRSDAPLRDI